MGLYAIILAGGFAKRLRPISDVMPKPLLHIDGVPLIEYILRQVIEVFPERIIVSTNKKFENNFRYWLRNASMEYNGIKLLLSVEPSTSEEEKLGAIGGLWYTIKLYNLDIDNNREGLLVVAGDNLFDFDLKPFISYARRVDGITIGAYNIGNRELAKRYGVIEVDKSGRVINFEEKPEKPKSSLISIGIYYIPSNKINKIGEFVERYKNADAIGKFFEWLVNIDNVYAYVFKGNWFDIGTPDSYLEADRWARERNLGRRWQWP